MFNSNGDNGGHHRSHNNASAAFLKDFSAGTSRTLHPEKSRAMRSHFTEPPLLFRWRNPADILFQRIYWTVRSAQFSLCYKIDESDVNSLNELIRFEPAERPPSLDQIREFTHNRFSDKWIKYMYAKFKNECPAGRMKAAEFKRLLGAYVPDRLSDAYLERLFRAFCHSSPYADQLTFKDLIVCLAQVCEQDARRNAEWTMRLISNGAVTSRTGRVNLEEFVDFVKSVFLLVGREMDGCGGRVKYESSERGTVDGGASDGGPTQSCSATNLNNAFETAGSTLNIFVVEKSTMKAINHRATAIFKELDVHNRGYLTVDNLEELFRVKTL